MQIEHLTWDSSFFNKDVFRFSSVESETELFKALSQLPPDCLIYVLCQNKLKNQILLDIKLTYSRKLFTPLQSSYITYDYEIRPLHDKTPSKELYKLAVQSGSHSRFNKDSNIPKLKFIELYHLWLENSLLGIAADQVFVAIRSGKQVGFVSLKTADDICRIGLISVDLAHQRKGIGLALLKRAIKFGRDTNCGVIQVVTQKANKLACRLYEKAGFELISEEYIYHIHL